MSLASIDVELRVSRIRMLQNMMRHQRDTQLVMAVVFSRYQADPQGKLTGPRLSKESNPWMKQFFDDIRQLQGVSDGGTFYDIITHHSLKQLYYDRYSYNPYQTHGSSNLNKHERDLHNNASVISIPQQFFGEKIKPKSVHILDN